MTESSNVEDVRFLASNLASLWNRGEAVLDRLVRAGGDPAGNPWIALRHLGVEAVSEVFAEPEARAELSSAVDALRRYMSAETWYDRRCTGDSRLARLQQSPIAYFCAEYGLSSWLPIYSGGLGVLAADMVKEASDMGIPFVGVGLFYRRGFFHQQLDAHDYQTEIVPDLHPADLGSSQALDPAGQPVIVPVPVADRQVYARVWRLQTGRVPLYLLDTDTPENERLEDREITASLYGGTQETRVQQEIVLGIGGVRALRAIGINPSLYSLNEGHAAFLGLELMLEALQASDYSSALSRVRGKVVYTNHTVVPAGNDVFPRDLVRDYLGTYVSSRGFAPEQLLALAGSGADDGFSMAVLAFQVSGKANAVSQLHASVIPREWPGYAVEAVTNGVHVPTWLGSEIKVLLDRYVPGWRGDNPDWERIHDIPDEELLEAHARQRVSLVDHANRVQDRAKLQRDALTLVWARRFAEYKRAWLIASDLTRLSRLLGNPERPVQIIISGKAHPRDEGGKRMLQELLQRLQNDAAIAARVAFLEDYNVREAAYLTAGADVWLNTPRKPLEASGTSGMKSSDNGCVQVTVTDGWAAEVDWWGVGWGITGAGDEADADELYRFLEEGVVPTYYDRDEAGIARSWASMMKRTMVVTLSGYSARRMLLEYLDKLYLPLLGQQAVESLSPA